MLSWNKKAVTPVVALVVVCSLLGLFYAQQASRQDSPSLPPSSSLTTTAEARSVSLDVHNAALSRLQKEIADLEEQLEQRKAERLDDSVAPDESPREAAERNEAAERRADNNGNSHDRVIALNDVDRHFSRLNEMTHKENHDFFNELFIAYRTPIKLNKVLRIPRMTPDDFENFYGRLGLPFVITSALDGSPAKSLTWTGFRAKFGGETFPTRPDSTYSRPDEIKNPSQLVPKRPPTMTMNISQVLDWKPSTGDKGSAYMGKIPLSDTFTDRLGLRLPMEYPRKTFLKPTMWLGAAGSATPLHMDGRDNFIFQLLGRKHFILYAHTDRPYLYTGGSRLQWAPIDATQPDVDYKKFPLFKNAHRLDVVLNPGEMLFLPTGWAHQIVNIEKCLMVNYWTVDLESQILKMSKEPHMPGGTAQVLTEELNRHT